MNTHLISARICERKSAKKTLAFLIDPKTIAVNDLVNQGSQLTIQHDSRIDWLELNELASKLLFRDKRLRLYVYDLENEEKVSLLSYCSYAQWVPGSDVVVAQGEVYY
jgi:intraflagellar transport protein 172